MSLTDISQLDITYLPGVGSRRAELLKKELGILVARDLLRSEERRVG